MPKTAIRVGPQDHGRRMSLADFDLAEGEPGYLYELSRGVVTVMDVPGGRHFVQVQAIRDLFVVYRLAHLTRVHGVATGFDCKGLLPDFESERRPDIAVYKTPLPRRANPWAAWHPALVVEVISPGSEHRDYVDKRGEYLELGVKEYWIVDYERRETLVLRNSRGQWAERVLRPGEVYRPRVLPGFEFDCAVPFRAAEEAEP